MAKVGRREGEENTVGKENWVPVEGPLEISTEY
jgi:hypothetical protein